jgi:exosortase sorting signal-containing protein
MIKHLSIILFLAVLYVPTYSNAAAVPAPSVPCPCDTLELSNGLNGNDILEIICPGGTLAEDGTSTIKPDVVSVAVQNPFSAYVVNTVNVDERFCSINTDGVSQESLQISEAEFELCKGRVILGCNLEMIRPIPTLSEWGLIALAGVLGVIGLVAIRRKRLTA